MFKSDLLSDKVVFVTGGGSGLGLSMTPRLLELGAKVVIASRRFELLQQEAENLMSATGGSVLPVQLDVRDPDSVSSALDAAEAEFGQVDALLNNAAGNFISPTERLSHRAFD